MTVPEGVVAVTAPLGLRPARGSMIWGLSTLNWKVPGAFSNSKGFPKDYHLPSQGLTHRHAAPNGPPPLAARAPGSLGTWRIVVWEIYFFLTSDHTSDHNLDCFIPTHGFAFYKWMLIFNLSRYLVFSLLNFSPHEEN